MIEWNDRYSVQIAEIDEQHKQLFEMIGNLSTAMKKGQSKEVLSEILDGLVKYAGQHFATEEKLFAEHNFPQQAEHKAKHDEFVGKIQEYNNLYSNGSNIVSVQLIGFLSDWLMKHIMKEDQEYAKFIVEAKAPCTA